MILFLYFAGPSCMFLLVQRERRNRIKAILKGKPLPPHVLCVDTGRSSETAKAHRG
eukprot:TRINITY_DN1853_c0_g1_i1.p3 TRINITY_DN1853_c0_g1~~TRINITY_DN1853_c0_g1_i1.p3  ORF type:complete len:56 (+),score=18.19 TRINITY_DN1853_c0_g1_i1:520-687(+)